MSPENPIDQMKATGMCPHGNFPSSCPLCAKERGETETAREVESYITERLQKEVSPERKAELDKELLTVSEFFDRAGIDAYIAGGTGIDLLDGKWNRDHQDLDMAIFGSNRQKFFNTATQAGFMIRDSGSETRPPKELSVEEVINSETHNAFLFRTNEQGNTQFEIIFLNETSTRDFELTKHVAAPRTSYEQAPRVTIAGKEVAIQPPDIILFHKLTDGRRKDFRDAKKVWDALEATQRERLIGYLRDADVRFIIDGKEITNVPALFEIAEQKDTEQHQAFFRTENVTGMENKLGKDFIARCDEVFDVKQQTTDRSAFFVVISEKYEGSIPERRVVLEAMSDYLYQTPAPSLEQFKAWSKKYVKLDERLKTKALHEYVSEKLWKIKTKGNI